MKSLLRFEFHKLFRKTSMYVCMLIIVGVTILNLLTANMMWELSVSLGEAGLMPDEIFAPSAATLTLQSLTSASFDLILGIFVALYMCEDVSDGIIKNIYAKGFHRSHVFFSKTIVALTYCVAAVLLCFGISFIGGLLMFPEGGGLSASDFAAMGIQLIVMLAYTCLFVLVATVCKKTGGAIAAAIVIPLVVSLALGVVDLIAQFDGFNLTDYWINDMWLSVTYINAEFSTLLTSLIGGMVYSVAFVLLSLVISQRKQV